MTADPHAINLDALKRGGADPKDIAFEIAGRLDPVVHAPLALAYKTLHSVTMRRVNRQPLYRALVDEEAKVRTGRGVTLDELEVLITLWGDQHALEEHFSPAPAVENWLARVNKERVVTSATREVVFAWQRLTRGWDDRSLWSLDWYLCRTLGAQLTQMADIAHGWPGTDEFPEFEDWTAALRKHGAALSFAADYDGADSGEYDEAVDAAAQESLRWVADHLGQLWD